MELEERLLKSFLIVSHFIMKKIDLVVCFQEKIFFSLLSLRELLNEIRQRCTSSKSLTLFQQTDFKDLRCKILNFEVYK